MITSKNWDFFKIEDILKLIKVKKYASIPLSIGNVPFVSSSSLNNGISTLCDEQPDITFPCITISTNGECFNCFYHDQPICISTDVEAFCGLNKVLNENIYLFLCTIINLERFKWNYGRKPKNNKVSSTRIKLPCKEVNGHKTPDWDFMDKYIANLKSKKTNKQSINDCLITNNVLTKRICVKKWKEFLLSDLFDEPYKAKAYVKGDLIEVFDNKDVPFISRTDTNNGCDGYIDGKISDYEFESGNAITIGDTTSTCYYQEYDFVCGDHIVVLRASWLNKYTALFIKTLIEKERFKYNYGRSFKIDLIKKTSIRVPVDEKGKPDWKYMEDYVKALPYADKI